MTTQPIRQRRWKVEIMVNYLLRVPYFTTLVRKLKQETIRNEDDVVKDPTGPIQLVGM
jgi:hypothetical protein